MDIDWRPGESIGVVRTSRLLTRIEAQFTNAQKVVEVFKNCNDEYETLGALIEDQDRLIFLIVVQNKPGIDDVFMVLDLGNGMSLDELKRWADWGGESDARRGEGDQGLGGKAAQRGLSNRASVLSSFRNGKLCSAGWVADSEGNYADEPQVMKERDSSGDYSDELEFNSPIDAIKFLFERYGFDVDQEWNGWDLSLEFEPDEPRQHMLDVLEARESFTLVAMVGISDFIPKSDGSRAMAKLHRDAVIDISSDLETESQARRSLSDSHVFMVHQQSKYTSMNLLREQWPELLEEVEPLKVEIEGPFVDPTTGQEFEPEGICSLELWPSKTLLQGPTWLSLKGVRINDGRNSVWIEAIPSGREPGAAQRIFGTFTVPSSKLGKFATVDRETVPDVPASRAIKAAITKILEDYRDTIADALREDTKVTKRESEAIQKDIEDRMKEIEKLIDMEAIFDDGTEGGTGSTGERAKFLDRILIEPQAGESLSNANIPTGCETKLSFRPLGTIESTRNDATPRTGPLEQLKGVRDYAPYFTISSSDSSVISVDDNFTIHTLRQGVATVTIASTDLILGDDGMPANIESNIELNVVDVISAEGNIEPATPLARNITAEVKVTAQCTDGTVISDEDTLFMLEVDGPAYRSTMLPLKIKTSKAIDNGEIRVSLGNGGVLTIPFETNEDIHEPEPRGPDGTDARRLPRLILCGVEHGITEEEAREKGWIIQSDTVQPSGDLPTLYTDPFWLAAGVHWLNLESLESRALLRTSSGKKAGTGTELYKRYIDSKTIEHAVMALMTSLVRTGKEPIPMSYTQIHNPRISAQNRLHQLYNAMERGELRPMA